MKKVSKFLAAVLLMSSLSSLSSCGDTPSDAVTNIHFVKPMKDQYSYGEVIDLSDVELEVTAANNSSRTYSAMDNDVSVEGIDTETIGKHTASFEINGYKKEWDYLVTDHYLTLNPMGGMINGDTENITLSFYNNQVDISSYIPYKFDSEGNELVFSGWYFDENLQNRATSVLPEIFTYDQSVTLYAGYDIKQSEMFNYVIDPVKQTATLVSINTDYLLGMGIWYIESITIPATVENYPVTEIGENFFNEENSLFSIGGGVKEIIFEAGSQVQVIGNKAFAALRNLEHIEFPETLVSIGDFAFQQTMLADIVIPKNVERIGKAAFSYNTGALEKIEFEAGSKIKVLGEECFKGDVYLSKINLPEGLQEIRDDAFSGCSELKSILLPSSVRLIGGGTFQLMASLKEILVDSRNPYFVSKDGNLYSKDMTKLIRYCNGNGEKEYTLPSMVKRIERDAFRMQGEYSKLKKLNLNEGLTYIGDEAFGNCDFSFTLPSTLNSFSLTAFKDYAGDCFAISEGNSKYTCKDGILYSKDFKTLYAVAANDSKSLIVLDNRVETISDYAFTGLKNLRTMIIDEDSALKVVKNHGLLLISGEIFQNLEIRLPRMFTVYNNTFFDSSYNINDGYAVTFKYDSCRDEFLTKKFDGKSQLFSNVVTYSESVSQVIRYIEGLTVNTYTSFSSFRKGVEPIFLGSIGLFDSDINRILSQLTMIYQDNLYDDDSIEYFAYFEKKVFIQFYQDYVENNTVNTLTMRNYRKLIDRYEFFPQAVKNLTSSLYEKIKKEYPYIASSSLESLYDEITAFPLGDEAYNDSECKKLLDKVQENHLESFNVPNQVTLKLSAMEVSSYIYDIETLKNGDHEDIYQIYSMMNPTAENNYYSLPMFVSGWFKTDSRKEMIYHYDEYKVFEEDFSNFMNAEYQNLVSEIDAFDLEADFSYDTYLSFYNSNIYYLNQYIFDALGFASDETLPRIYLICADIEINDLIRKHENSTLTFNYYCTDLIDSYLGQLDETFMSKVIDYDQYLALSTSIRSEMDAKVLDCKNRLKNFVIDSHNLSNYFTILNDDLVSFGDYFGQFFGSNNSSSEDTYDYVEQYYILFVSYISDYMFSKYPETTDSNISEQKKELFGYFDMDTFEYQEGFYDTITLMLSQISDPSRIYRYADFLDRLNTLQVTK